MRPTSTRQTLERRCGKSIRWERWRRDSLPGTVQNIGFGFPGPLVHTQLFDIVPVGDGSGRVYVGGVFENNTAVNHLVRLNSNGAIDPTFVPGFTHLGVDNFPSQGWSGDLYVMTYGVGPSAFTPLSVERRNADGQSTRLWPLRGDCWLAQDVHSCGGW